MKWNAKTYSQFLTARTRPARDLLAAIPANLIPEYVYDLGCGPGNSTVLLHERWPHAHIVGIDSSEDMLSRARTHYPNIEFIHGDIAHFTASKQADVIFANASLQWVDNHNTLFINLIRQLKSGGCLAVQMPNNFHRPAHQITIKLLQQNKKWQPLLEKLIYGELDKPLYQAEMYYDLLSNAGLKQLQLWQTEYFQEMPNHEAIFDWSKSTALRPVLNSLSHSDQVVFKALYINELKKSFSIQTNGKVLFCFNRFFMIGEKNR